MLQSFPVRDGDNNWLVYLNWDEDVVVGSASGTPTLNGVPATTTTWDQYEVICTFPPTAVPTYDWVWDPRDLVAATDTGAPLQVTPYGSPFYSAGTYHCTGITVGGGDTQILFHFTLVTNISGLEGIESEGNNPLSKTNTSVTITTNWLTLGAGADVHLLPEYVTSQNEGFQLNPPYTFRLPG